MFLTEPWTLNLSSLQTRVTALNMDDSIEKNQNKSIRIEQSRERERERKTNQTKQRPIKID